MSGPTVIVHNPQMAGDPLRDALALQALLERRVRDCVEGLGDVDYCYHPSRVRPHAGEGFTRRLMLALQRSGLVNPIYLSAKLRNCFSLLSNIPEYMRAKREPIVADITAELSWLGNENRAVLSPHFRIIVSKQVGVPYCCKHAPACLRRAFYIPSGPAATPDIIRTNLRVHFLLTYRSVNFKYTDFVKGIIFTREYAVWSGGAPELFLRFPYSASLGRLYSGREDVASCYRHVHQLARIIVLCLRTFGISKSA